ncbi:MAG: glycoside hydrolase family 127 protein [Clostridia bacterium]|nr:glycoside hydrolase family 127 protein [Clostridia bacterium]
MIPYKLQGADYAHVTLLDSPFRRQRDETMELYLRVPSNEDILHRYRIRAGIPSTAEGMTGWGPSIGQYLGAYAKWYRNTGDRRLRQKAADLFRGWCECVEKDESLLDCGTYVWEKFLGGFLDLYEYMGLEEVRPWILRITEYARKTFYTDIPRDGLQSDAMRGQIEWYTLPENLYRAWQLFGDEIYLQMAGEWLYPYLWDKLARGEKDIGPRHAYSHVNSLSSAARAYIVTEDPHYLEVIRKGYEEISGHHTYVTGGYGPGETLFGEDPGYLGNAILPTWDRELTETGKLVYKNFVGKPATRSDAWGSCEVSCCSWAVFKLCNYLLKLTGDARYGDWCERLLYNGTLGQPPVTEKGQILYYASYFLDGALKSYEDRRLQHLGQNFVWQCCTGTFPQDTSEYANMIAYFDDDGVYISQLIPAAVDFTAEGQQVTLFSDGDLLHRQEARLRVRVKKPAAFALRVRFPSWAGNGNQAFLNGKALSCPLVPDTWMTVERVWKDGDEVVIRLPFRLEFVPVDPQHPNVVALKYGPIVLCCDEMTVLTGDVKHPETWIIPVRGEDNTFRTLPGHSGFYKQICRTFRPYYSVGLMSWYYMYNRIYPDMETLDREHQGT